MITTKLTDGTQASITVNSFSSVSLSPALISWCLDSTSETFDIFARARHFTVNILSSQQKNVADYCARQEQRTLHALPTMAAKVIESPRVQDSLAVLECEVHDRHTVGDHVIYIGRVLHWAVENPAHGPLVYYKGSYKGLA